MINIFAGILTFIVLMVTSVTWASPVPDTGQAKCFDFSGYVIPCPSPGLLFYGQDGNYSINPMSYTKLDGSGNLLPDSAASWVMVRDNVTGLIWEMKNNKDGVKNYNDPHDADNTYTWYDSNPATNGGNVGIPGNGTDTEDFINALNIAHYGNYTDWRLPTIKELANTVDLSFVCCGAKINPNYFYDTMMNGYWSSTPLNVGYAYTAFFLDYASGISDTSNMGTTNHNVRAVRGGQSGSSYTDNVDGTVTDTITGLMWQKKTVEYPMPWGQALSYCQDLNLGGYTDWRLPSFKELQSIVDYNNTNPAINMTYFPNTHSSNYWSSTTFQHEYFSPDAFSVNFEAGTVGRDFKTYNFNVRAVRGGQFTPPTLEIKANGQDGQITVTANTPVSITASLSPGDPIGQSADWWIAEGTPWGIYTLTASGWLPEINMLFQYPLISVSPVEIYNGLLPVGDYDFYFAVDMSPNGIFDSPFYYDFVQIHVVN